MCVCSLMDDYSGTSKMRTPLGPVKSVLIREVSPFQGLNYVKLKKMEETPQESLLVPSTYTTIASVIQVLYPITMLC